MKYVYPAVFHPEKEGGYSIWFPDIKRGATQGDTLAEGIEMATDFLNLAVYSMEQDGVTMPKPRNPRDVEVEKDDIVTLISADSGVYKQFYANKLVNKTLVLPSWLNEKATAAGINFSQTLQTALKEKLLLASAE